MDALAEAQTVERGYAEVLRIISKNIGAVAGAVWIADEQTRKLDIEHAWLNADAAIEPSVAARLWLACTPALNTARAIQDGGGAQWRVLSSHDNPFAAVTFGGSGVRAIVAVPVRARQTTIGALEFLLASPQEPDAESVECLERIGRQLGAFAADRSAYEIQHAMLQERLRQTSAQLREGHMRYQALVEEIPVLTYTFIRESADRLVYISPQVTDWLGYKPEECTSEPDWWDKVVHPEDAARVAEILRGLAQENTHVHLEHRLVSLNGDILWVHNHASLVRDWHGEASYVQGAMTDVTELKQADENIRAALAKEHELNELKNRFISMVSHEFRTPLSIILSSAELIERYGERLPTDKRKRYIQQIRTCTTNMADVLQDILLLGRYDSGKTDFTPHPMGLVQYCRDLVDQIQMVTGDRCKLVFSHRGDCADACMDDKLLQHILTNLLSNAIKYSTQPDPSVEFTLDCDGSQAIFQIIDHGIGIPPSDQGRIFDPFHRAGNTASVMGTGLGLTIVQRAIQTHGGSSSFVSELGQGTTFTVVLPLR